jgi:hypothetical protein
MYQVIQGFAIVETGLCKERCTEGNEVTYES